MTGDPDPVSSYLELIEEFYRTNNHENALTVAGDRLIELAPNEPTGYLTRAALRISDPDATDSSELLQRAVELDPESGMAWHYLLQAYLKENEPEKALEAAEEYIRFQPDTALAFDTRARVYFHMKQFKSAINDCDIALNINTGWADWWSLRAEAKAALGDYAGAKEDIAEAVSRDPNDPEIAKLHKQIFASA